MVSLGPWWEGNPEPPVYRQVQDIEFGECGPSDVAPSRDLREAGAGSGGTADILRGSPSGREDARASILVAKTVRRAPAVGSPASGEQIGDQAGRRQDHDPDEPSTAVVPRSPWVHSAMEVGSKPRYSCDVSEKGKGIKRKRRVRWWAHNGRKASLLSAPCGPF